MCYKHRIFALVVIVSVLAYHYVVSHTHNESLDKAVTALIDVHS